MGFTLLMAALVLLLVDKLMALAEAGKTLDVSAYQVQSVVLNYTRDALAEQDIKGVRRLALDESSESQGP